MEVRENGGMKEKIRWLEYNNFPFDGTMVLDRVYLRSPHSQEDDGSEESSASSQERFFFYFNFFFLLTHSTLITIRKFLKQNFLHYYNINVVRE